LFFGGIYHEERQEEKRVKAIKKVERTGKKHDPKTWEENDLLALDTITDFVSKVKRKRQIVYYSKRKHSTMIMYLN